MIQLILVTLIWAFSFSLIGNYLSNIDISFSTFSRIFLAFLVFIPFIRWNLIANRLKLDLMCVGAVQIGLMYLFYYTSFRYISVPDILLFTIFTPIYIALIYDWIKFKQIRISYLWMIALAVLGAATIRYQTPKQNFLVGFLLIQFANLCFAWGQVYYKILFERHSFEKKQSMIWFYAGALFITFIVFILSFDPKKLPDCWQQWSVILWLGIIASGIGYFLWNSGATKVNSGILAMMNNAIIPIGILINVFLFHQDINWIRFLLGSFIIVIALLLHAKQLKKFKIK